MGDRLGLPCLGTPGAVDFLANPQLPSVASMANPLGGPGRGSSLGSETHPAFIIFIIVYLFHSQLLVKLADPQDLLKVILYHLQNLRLLIFTPFISSATLNIFLVYKLNKFGDNMQSCRTPFFILNSDVIPFSVLAAQPLTVPNTVWLLFVSLYHPFQFLISILSSLNV